MTRLTRSVVEVSSRPRRTAAVSGVPSYSASSPAISRVSVAHAAARELGEEPAEDLGQRQVRGDRPGRLGREQRRVDRVAGAPPVEDVEDLRGDLLGDEDLGLGGRGAEVRREQRVRRVEQRRAGRRLVLEDVDPGAAEVARPQRLGDGRLVDDAAAGDVEDDRAGLQLGDRRRARSGRGSRASAGRGRSRRRRGRAARRSSTSSTPWLAACSAVTNGSTAEDRHLHRPRPDGDGLADLAEPDDPERPAAQLEAGELGALPLAAPDRRVGRRRPAGEPVQQGERVLGGRDRVAGRGVDDDDARPASPRRGRRCPRRRRPGR